MICENKKYEKIIRGEVEAIRVFSEHIEIARKNEEVLMSKIS